MQVFGGRSIFQNFGSIGVQAAVGLYCISASASQKDPTCKLELAATPPFIAEHEDLADPCGPYGTSIVSLTDQQVLFLCGQGMEVARFSYSAGRQGFGKNQEGDLRTPIGTYPLGEPRHSSEFGLFIPIGYPTPEQIKQGHTGSDIGIHGPARRFRCVGFLNVMINWTQGCLAVANDELIENIARWMTRNPEANLIHILSKSVEPQGPQEPQ